VEQIMAIASEPNWLIVIGLIYVAYAFGLLGISAAHRGAQNDPASVLASASKQRVCYAFAGFTGLLGALMQALGQVVHLGEGLAVVVMLLGLVVLLLSYLAFSGRMAKLSERDTSVRRPSALTTHASSPATFGQAAE
jgi:hypothetical protein